MSSWGIETHMPAKMIRIKEVHSIKCKQCGADIVWHNQSCHVINNTVNSADYLKLSIISKNALNKSCRELNFKKKTQWAHICVALRSGPSASQDCHVSNIIMYWKGKVDWRSQNYRLYRKTLQTKVVENQISYRKLSGRKCLFSAGVDLGGYLLKWGCEKLVG